ncbi:unnamed protein product [Owenia fusiformis]|uniref:Uncharacterized protein n=1 Tax=Owenia fusiformis TaxID=6347 RepID=A0A8J1UQG1_OWEFU|nr:unnamed protein product [Owenia fusiformis]
MSPRSVLITGCNRGIGLEFVKQFLSMKQPPKHLFATCRNPAEAADLQALQAGHSNLHILQLEVTDESRYASLAEEVGAIVEENGLNLLINNAGILIRTNLPDVTAEVMKKTFDVNSIAPILISQAFLPLLKRAADAQKDAPLGWARAAIVNVSSKVGSCDDNKRGGLYAYRASKAALNVCTVSLARDLFKDGILATVVHPGWVLTDIGTKNALIESSESISGMLKVMQGLNEETNASFYDYAGKLIPW